MRLVIDVPMTDEELENEFAEQLEDFRRSGLLPTEEPNRGEGTPLEENDCCYNCENWIP